MVGDHRTGDRVDQSGTASGSSGRLSVSDHVVAFYGGEFFVHQVLHGQGCTQSIAVFFDAWGFSLDVGWNNIERVKTITVFPGLSYLKVFSPELKRPLWLPLFLRNREDFFKVVTKYARPDSPLIEGLRAAGFGDSEAWA